MSSDPGLLPSLKKLQRTIKSERRVLETLPEAAHKDVAYANLAGSLSDLFDITGDQAALEEAIELGRKALSSCTDDDPDRAEYCTQLAGDLSKLYKYTYDGNALEEAIQLARQALALCPTLEQDPDSEQPRDVCCYELAICLKQRYARTGDILVLEESIQLFRETLSLRPIGHFARQETCSSLGIALRDRYKVAHDEEDIHEALRLQREALLICPSDSKWLATLHNDVADCLDDIFDLTGDVKLLEEALELDRKALSFPCHKPDDHTTRMIALCYRIWAIYLRTKDVGILDEAMLHVDEQLSDSVSRLHQDELWCLASVIHLERDTPHFDPTRAVTYLRYLVETPQSDIAWLWETLLPLLHSLVALDDIRSKEFASSTLQVLSSAINLLPKRAGFVLDPQHQLQNIQEASELGLQALTVATYAGQPNIGLELMEYTRGFMWSQALYVHDPQLRDLPADLGEELKKLLMAMRDKPKAPWSKFLTPEDMHRALMELRHTKASRIEAILRDVRQLPGLEHFMTGPSLTQLHHLAQVCPYAIVVLAVTGQICRAYMVRPPREENENSEDRLMVLDLPITLPELEKLGKATSNSAIRQSLYRGHNPEFEPTRAMIVGRAKSHANGLEIIWKKIVHPVLQALQLDQNPGCRRRPRLYWCPTGYFTFLPLHASGLTGSKTSVNTMCMDYVVSSYTPTLSALVRARRGAIPLDTSKARMLLIGESSATIEGTNRLPALPNIRHELSEIANVAIRQRMQHISTQRDKTTIMQVSQALPFADIVHLACHGIQDHQNALASSFCLGDGKLSISEIMDLNMSRKFLAFLSACETAKGDEEQPDQVLHLAASMLFTGFRSVVATMWAINDADGPVVAKCFYQQLLAKDTLDDDDVAFALDAAIRDLRVGGAPPERWAPFIHIGA